MSAHVLLNLLNKLKKRDKMQGLLSIILLFCDKFNKFNNIGAWMLDSIYHMILIVLWNHVFGKEMLKFCHTYATLTWDSFHNVTKICKSQVVYWF